MTLEDEVARLLKAERGVQPPPNAAERGLERLLADLAGPAAALPIAGGALNLGWSLLSKSLLLGFVVGTAGAFTAAQVWSPPAATVSPTSPPAATSANPALAGVQQPLAPPPTLPPMAAAASAAPTHGRATASQAAPVAPSAPATTFDEELRLITLAKRELDGGRRPRARAYLLEHARLFPAGVFSVDREALQILTECAGGSQQDSAVRAFAARHPGSPLIDRLERSCSGGTVEKPARGAFPEIVK
jgi:hypothetical protein